MSRTNAYATRIFHRWSFGVVLYEIFSAGKAPYADICAAEVLERVRSGYRMGQPDLCPHDLYASLTLTQFDGLLRYQLMLECWEANPEDRPTFEKLQHYFAECLEHYYNAYGYVSFVSDLP